MISPIVIAKYRQADILPVKMLLVNRFLILCFTAGMGLVSLALVGLNQKTALAQMPATSVTMPLGEKTISQVNVLFVNPSVGDDTNGNGSERAPLKTITQALHHAGANTVIMLSKGTYSAETGEVFPLILKPGVSIQGDSAGKGRGILILGGGEYLSRSFGGQNVAIVAANQAGLSGVTLTNSNPRGYGLWIEYSSPVVGENTFTANTQDGISINGNSAPTISKNYFYRNGANGITIAGNSRAEVRENIFEQTGFGINIAQNAQPLIIGNQIQYNRAGIIVQANARPTLRQNLIQGSKEDGIVAIASAIPDLGNASEPGGNEFRNNARFDINASAAKQVISASGNILASNRISGRVDTNGTTATLGQNSQPNSLPKPELSLLTRNVTLGQNSQPNFLPKPELSLLTRNVPITPTRQIRRNNFASEQLNTQLTPLLPANSPLSPQPTPTIGEFPTPNSLLNTIANTSDTAQLNYVRIDPNTIEFTARQPSSNSISPQGLTLPTLNAPSTSTTPDTSISALPPGGFKTGSRYRVMVEIETDRDRELVGFLAPGAFPTVRQGRGVMQVGVFSNRYNADQMLKILSSNGLKALIED